MDFKRTLWQKIRESELALYLLAMAATAHIAIAALPSAAAINLPYEPQSIRDALNKAQHWASPYLNILFMNYNYGFYGAFPGISQAVNIQMTRQGQKEEFWLQDHERYDTDLSFLRHFCLGRSFAHYNQNDQMRMAVAKNLSKYLCAKEQVDTVRITLAMHPELTREQFLAQADPNASQTFYNPFPVSSWTCESRR